MNQNVTIEFRKVRNGALTDEPSGEISYDGLKEVMKIYRFAKSKEGKRKYNFSEFYQAVASVSHLTVGVTEDGHPCSYLVDYDNKKTGEPLNDCGMSISRKNIDIGL